MPLSLIGVDNIAAATRELGIPLILVNGEALWDELDVQSERATIYSGEQAASQNILSIEDEQRLLISKMVRAGATVHYPAILVYKESDVVGSAILGFRTGEAYRGLISERLDPSAVSDTTKSRTGDGPQKPGSAGFAEGNLRDIEVAGRPGAYFRYIPESRVVGFESEGQNYTLDLDSRKRFRAPGVVDLVGSPDSLFLVTPRGNRGGLEFYETADVFNQQMSATMLHSPIFAPFFVDLQMRDQYPSIGVLVQGERSTKYRVLTSWFDGIVHRDYEIRYAAPNEPAIVRPLGKPTQTCPKYQLSLPILAQNGQEVAARDEASGTMKVFRINDDSSCDEVLDIGMQTGKVAWDSTGRRIAFAIPRGVALDENEYARNLYGVFILDRESFSLTRVPGSEDVDRLTFPEFVEDTTVIFLVRGKRSTGERDRFRLFCCLS